MIKKLFNKFTLIIILFSITASVLVGYSLWIITDGFGLRPDNKTDEVIVKYFDGQDVTYEGCIFLPTPERAGIPDHGIKNEDLTYYFRTESNAEFVEVDLNAIPAIGPRDAGTYEIKIKYNLYDDKVHVKDGLTFTIHKANIDFEGFNYDDQTKTYNREHQYIDYLGRLPEGVNSVSFSGGGINASTTPYDVTITFNIDTVNYNAVNSITKKLTIMPKNLSDSSIVLYFENNNNNSFLKSQIANIEPTFKVKDSNELLVLNSEYTVAFSNLTTVLDDNNVTITGVGNYTGQKSISYDIKPLELRIEEKGTQHQVVYNGQEVDISDFFDVKDSINNIVSNASITYQYKLNTATNYESGKPVNAGLYQILITASLVEYVSASKTIEVIVNRKSITNADVTIAASGLVYTGNQHTPGIDSATVDGLTLDSSNYTLSYFNNTDAGTNTAKVIITGIGNFKDTKEVSFSIAKADLVLTNPIYKNTNFIQGEMPVVQTNGNAKFNGSVVATTITNNIATLTFTAGANPTESKTVIHTFTPTDRNANNISNYNVATSNNATLTMYAVGYNKTQNVYYGTIEEALNKAVSGDSVWVVPEIVNNTTFYPTIKNNCEIKTGVSFILAYAKSIFDDSSNTTGYRVFDNGASAASADTTDSSTGNPAYAKINQNITFTVNSGSNLIIGGFVSNNSAVGKHGVLFNEGTIELKNNSNTYAYGFLIGHGLVNARSGAKIYDCLRMHDFPTARFAGGMYYGKYRIREGSGTTYNNIFPLNSYSAHNLSCELKFYQGAIYSARAQINVTETMFTKEVILMGAGGLFELTTSGGYIKRTVRDTYENTFINSSFSVNNQKTSQQEVYEFYTDVNDNSVTVSFEFPIVGEFSMSTSKSIAMPIGMIDVTVKNGYTFTFEANSYKFLPGSRLKIEQGATLNVTQNSNIIFYNQYYDNFIVINENGSTVQSVTMYMSYYYQHQGLYNNDNAHSIKEEYKPKLIVNGTVNCNGSLGGIIETESLGAIINLASGSASLNRLTSIKFLDNTTAGLAAFSAQDLGGKVKIDTVTPMMKLLAGQTIQNKYSNVGSGTYYSCKDSTNKYGWYTDKLKIYYDLNGGTGTTPQVSDEKDSRNGYVITASDIPNVTTSRAGYEAFNNVWALDPEGTMIVEVGVTTLYANTTLYAVWIPSEYHITYNYRFYQEDGSISSTAPSDFEITNLNPQDYYITSTIILKNPTNNKNLEFGGWYNDSSCSLNYKIDTIQNEYGDKILYALFYPEGTDTITIQYQVVADDGLDGGLIANYLPAPFKAPIVNDVLIWNTFNIADRFNNDTNQKAYFAGYFYDQDCTVPYDGSINNIRYYLVDGRLSIYTRIKEKTKVIINFNGGSKSGTSGLDEGAYYFAPGQSFLLPTLTINQLYDYTWSLSSNTITLNGSNATLSSNPPLEITLVWTYRLKCVLTVYNKSNYNATVTVYMTDSSGEHNIGQKAINKNNNGSWDVAMGSRIRVYVSTSKKSGDLITNHEMISDHSVDITNDSCITETTLINLYDGTVKMVKDLSPDDLLLVFDHEKGIFTFSKAIFLIHKNDASRVHRIINLNFTNGKTIEIVSEHGFFDLTLNKYVYINELNINDFINHEFVYTSDFNTIESVKLIDYSITEKYTKVYSPITYKYYNFFVDGILNVTNYTDGIYAYFEMGENLKYDEKLREKDIETYGLFTYDELKHLGTYEEYLAFDAMYLKVAIGKGYTTLDEIQRRIELFITKDNYFYDNNQ